MRHRAEDIRVIGQKSSLAGCYESAKNKMARGYEHQRLMRVEKMKRHLPEQRSLPCWKRWMLHGDMTNSNQLLGNEASKFPASSRQLSGTCVSANQNSLSRLDGAIRESVRGRQP
jgi:hypothetical protein